MSWINDANEGALALAPLWGKIGAAAPFETDRQGWIAEPSNSCGKSATIPSAAMACDLI